MRDPKYVPTPEDTADDVAMVTVAGAIAGAGLGLIAYGVFRILRSVRMSE